MSRSIIPIENWVHRELNMSRVDEERKDWFLRDFNILFSPVTKTGTSTMASILQQLNNGYESTEFKGIV